MSGLLLRRDSKILAQRKGIGQSLCITHIFSSIILFGFCFSPFFTATFLEMSGGLITDKN